MKEQQKKFDEEMKKTKDDYDNLLKEQAKQQQIQEQVHAENLRKFQREQDEQRGNGSGIFIPIPNHCLIM